MPANKQRTIQFCSDLVQILNSSALTFCFRKKTEIKVFFPADYRAVCPTESYIGSFVRQQKSNSRDLSLPADINLIDMPAELHLTEAAAFRHFIHQERTL